MISIDKAFEIIDGFEPAESQPLAVPVREALNNVLREDVIAKTDSPRRDNTAMDGFVFRKKDLDEGRRRFPVTGEVRPEMQDPASLAPGTCARIMTGATIPEGGDFIVPVELTRTTDAAEKNAAKEEEVEWTEVLEVPKKNAIRRQGEGFRKGDVLIPAGTMLCPYDLGLLIESGNTQCIIRKPLSVALQVTGSEINLQNNTNGPVLSAIMSGWPGIEVTEWPVLRDDPGAVRSRLRDLKSTSDVIVTTGGISAGAHDFLFDVLTDLGAECIIRKIKQKPGKPITIFRWEDAMVINLPGNPVSATATAEIYARRIARRLLNLSPDPVFQVSLHHKLSNNGDRTVFMPAALSVLNGRLVANSQEAMQSHLMQLYRGNRVYLRLEPDAKLMPGDQIGCYVVTDAFGLTPAISQVNMSGSTSTKGGDSTI